MKWTSLKKGNKVLLNECGLALGFFSRFLGLMGKASFPNDKALLFPKCNSVHTFFMRFDIDVIFLDSAGNIVDVATGVHPWRLLLPRRKAKHTLEMNKGVASKLGIAIGDKLVCEGVF